VHRVGHLPRMIVTLFHDESNVACALHASCLSP